MVFDIYFDKINKSNVEDSKEREAYENNETKEARLANDLDKLDMYVQSIDYEKKNPDLDLEEFRISARKAISTPIVEEILKSLEK